MDDKDVILVLAGLVILYLLFKGCENKVNVVPKGDIKYITQYRFVDPRDLC
jgi:hypothetical protein